MRISLLCVLSTIIFQSCFAQEIRNSNKPEMMYADSSRRGKPWSKNPHVIRFGGRYLMYTSVLPVEGSKSREIEITESQDLIHWKNVGMIRIEEAYEQNGISAPGVLVMRFLTMAYLISNGIQRIRYLVPMERGTAEGPLIQKYSFLKIAISYIMLRVILI